MKNISIIQSDSLPSAYGIVIRTLIKIKISFIYRYELNDGQIVASQGALKTVNGADGPVQVAVSVGQYSFVGPDGLTYWVNWTADENGFHPVVGTGPAGGIQGGSNIDPNALKSLIG